MKSSEQLQPDEQRRTEQIPERRAVLDNIRRQYGILYFSMLPEGEAQKQGFTDDTQLYREQFKASGTDVRIRTVHALMENLPSTVEEEGVIIGGAPVNVRDENPKYRQAVNRVMEFTQAMAKKNIPFLGVCLGHQIIGEVYGGENTVVLNPKGREFGRIKLTLTSEGKENKLFSGITETLYAYQAHRYIIDEKRVPADAKVTVTGGKSVVQGMKIGDNIVTVQFHPEENPAGMQALAKLRREGLIRDGVVSMDTFPEFLESMGGETAGQQILANFVEHFVHQRTEKKV